jgi:flagellar biosynthesis anti-sigma factor FlgM
MILPITQSPMSSDNAEATGSSAAARPGANTQAAGAETAAGEAVTVSADANTSTQLLDAARNADGMDDAAVQRLRSAVQGGTYDVSPQDLARAMTNAARETAP